MPLPFPITAVDSTLSVGGAARVDVRSTGGSSTVGYADVAGYSRSVVVVGSDVLFAKKDNQQTATLRVAAIGQSGVAPDVVASTTRADAASAGSAAGVVQDSTGAVFGFFATHDLSNSNPRVTLFNASLSTTFSANYYGSGKASSVGRIGWVSFDDGSIADIATEAYV